MAREAVGFRAGSGARRAGRWTRASFCASASFIHLGPAAMLRLPLGSRTRRAPLTRATLLVSKGQNHGDFELTFALYSPDSELRNAPPAAAPARSSVSTRSTAAGGRPALLRGVGEALDGRALLLCMEGVAQRVSATRNPYRAGWDYHGWRGGLQDAEGPDEVDVARICSPSRGCGSMARFWGLGEGLHGEEEPLWTVIKKGNGENPSITPDVCPCCKADAWARS
jgi:hypothetical protein